MYCTVYYVERSSGQVWGPANSHLASELYCGRNPPAHMLRAGPPSTCCTTVLGRSNKSPPRAPCRWHRGVSESPQRQTLDCPRYLSKMRASGMPIARARPRRHWSILVVRQYTVPTTAYGRCYLRTYTQLTGRETPAPPPNEAATCMPRQRVHGIPTQRAIVPECTGHCDWPI